MPQSAAEILAQETAALRSTLNPLALLTPTNYLAERQKWLDGGRKSTNPYFIYDPIAIRHASCQITQILQNLDEIQQYYLCCSIPYDPLSLVSKALSERIAELAYLRRIFDDITCPTKATHTIAWKYVYGDLKASDIDPQYTAVCTLAFSASGKSLIGIPADRKVNGLKLIELIGHELNSHYRSAMSTRNIFRYILEYRGKSDLAPLVHLLSHSLNETLSEGLAKLSDTQILGSSGLPKPYPVLAIDFIKQGHNFQETMEYVYDLSLKNQQSVSHASHLSRHNNACTS